MNYLIRNADIVDGSGGPRRRGDVMVENGQIAGVGCYSDWNGEVIEAQGFLLCPGFIDLHRHCDFAVFTESFGRIELAQGITAAAAGNCGMAPVPLRSDYADGLLSYMRPCLGEGAGFADYTAYRGAMEKADLPINIGFFAGMGALRIAARGFDGSPYTEGEMDCARSLLREAMQAGALGLSIGLMYVPEAYSTAEETARLASAMRGTTGYITAHMRWETEQLAAAVREVIQIAEAAEVPLNISHFKAAGTRAWGGVLARAVEEIERARAQGMDVTVDFYPYDCGSTTMMQMVPPSMLADGMEACVNRLSRGDGVEELRRKLREGEPDWDNLAQTIGWDRTMVTSVSLDENRKYLGCTVTDGARQHGWNDEAELAAHLLSSERGGVGIINRSMSQEDIDTVARLPYSTLISDSLYGNMEIPHPRLMGSFPKFLREYVRERGVLTLEEAVKKMTWMPAQRASLKGRGLVREGYHADLVLLDERKFRDRADFDHPALLSDGPELVIIAGKPVWKGQNVVERGAGSVLTPQK